MSITTSTHTRRRGEGACLNCKGPILPGEQYGKLVAVQSEAFDDDFVLQTWHMACETAWQGQMRARYTVAENRIAHAARSAETFEYIRKRYGVDFRVGQLVYDEDARPGMSVGQNLGIVTGGEGAYVTVQMLRAGVDGLHHPGGLTVLREGMPTDRPRRGRRA